MAGKAGTKWRLNADTIVWLFRSWAVGDLLFSIRTYGTLSLGQLPRYEKDFVICTWGLVILYQSLLFDRFRVLRTFQPTWLVDRFFLETLGTPYSSVASIILDCWPESGDGRAPLREIEQQVIGVRGLSYFSFRS